VTFGIRNMRFTHSKESSGIINFVVRLFRNLIIYVRNSAYLFIVYLVSDIYLDVLTYFLLAFNVE
jgi:hypothetical protein